MKDAFVFLKKLSVFAMAAFTIGAVSIHVVSYFALYNSASKSIKVESFYTDRENLFILPEGFEFSEVQYKFDNDRRLVLSGQLLNKSDYSWSDPYVRVLIFIDSMMVKECGEIQYYNGNVVARGDSQVFRVICEGVYGDEVPAEVTFRLAVDRAHRN